MNARIEQWDEPRPVPLTVDDFLHLADAGAFDDYRKIELIEGVIVGMNSQYSRHARVKSLLSQRLAVAVAMAMPGYEVWSEATVAMRPRNAPEPDILVTNFVPPPERVPVPVESVALLVEVADTTRRSDLRTKPAIYARGGVPEYWVLDLEKDVLHRFWNPGPDGYAERDEAALGGRAASATVPGLAVETAGL